MVSPNFNRIFLLALVLLGVFYIASLIFKPNHPKNLLIISIDTLRADHMGVYGYSKDTTPNIDKWAERGTVYTNFRTVVPMTQPSFAALMTGKDPAKTRVITNLGTPVSDNSKTLATILRENGFDTHAIITKGYVLDQGFNEATSSAYKFPYFLDGEEQKSGQERYKHLTTREAYEDFALSSIDWLDRNKDEKFFLWVHLMDPHAPYFPPDDLKCKFNEAYCDEIEDKSLEEIDALRAEYQSCQEKPIDKERLELMETLYDGNIAAGDRLVGKILNKLDSLGLDENTIVVIYSDHGEGFDHNYYFNHRAVLYESAIKVPLIIINPENKNFPLRSDILIQNTDFLPTILDMLGVDSLKYRFDGLSFATGKSRRNESVSINNNWTKYSITDGSYKYIYSMEGACLADGESEELYNIKNDPLELENIYSRDEEAQTLKRKLFDYLSEYNLPVEVRPGFYPEVEETENLETLGY